MPPAAAAAASEVLARKRRSHMSDADYFESYIPAGILRRGWVEKHTSRVPPLVVLAFPLDPRQSTADWAAAEAAILGAYSDARTLYAADRGASCVVVLVNVQDMAQVGGALAGGGGGGGGRGGGGGGGGGGGDLAAASPGSSPGLLGSESFRVPPEVVAANVAERVAGLRRRGGLDTGALLLLAGACACLAVKWRPACPSGRTHAPGGREVPGASECPTHSHVSPRFFSLENAP